MKKEAAIACLQQPLDNLVSLHFRPDAIVNTQGLAQVHEYFSVYQILWFGIDAPIVTDFRRNHGPHLSVGHGIPSVIRIAEGDLDPA